jgi:hypothetical protein
MYSVSLMFEVTRVTAVAVIQYSTPFAEVAIHLIPLVEAAIHWQEGAAGAIRSKDLSVLPCQ